MVPALLHDILEHCGSQDAQVCNAGLYTLLYFLCVCSSQLQASAAREVLLLMKQNLHSPATTWGWGQQKKAMACLSRACPALNTAQQQECAALLVSMLKSAPDHQRQLDIISELRTFWRSVADPWVTYAATAEQVLQLERSGEVHLRVRRELGLLL